MPPALSKVGPMHSEHRHQLQQNDLGQLTVKAIPWFEKHGMQLLVGVGLLVVVLIGGIAWWSLASGADSEAWSELALAESVEQFGDVADRFPGTLAAGWANLRAAEMNFSAGVKAMFRDRELGKKDLEAARAGFDRVLGSSVELPDAVRERAMMGLARVLESTSDGDTGPAVEAYERLLQRFPESIHKEFVQKRIEQLKSTSAKEFYAWFHQQKPEPADFPAPRDGRSQTLPMGNPFDLPPGMSLPAGLNLPPELALPPEAAPPPASTPSSPDATPESPESSDTPAAPASPEKPDTPAPAAPATPESPDAATPEKPETPAATPEKPTPEKPESPAETSSDTPPAQ